MALTKVTGDFIKAGVITQAHLHSSHGITSTHIAEGDKLFFTNARVDSRIGDLSTSNLSEGSNLYYTDARARGAISVSGNALSYNSSTGVITSNFEESPTFTGAVVGASFSAAGGFLNGSNGGIRIHSSGTKFFNITAANAARDGVMDIGASDARFKDLYLSGNITAGGNITASSGTGHFSVVNSSGYQLNGTYVMDSSRNLVNIAAITASGDIVAPGIYVGSANTSYDFYNNGTSYLNGTVTVDADLNFTAGDFNIGGVRIVGDNDSADQGTAFIRSNGDYLVMNAADGEHVYLNWDSANGGSGHVYVDNALYAQIFYDRNNTNYYCDPNGQSRLYTLNIGNSPTSGVTSGYMVQVRGGGIHMTNNDINYVGQLHFNDNVRLYDNGDDSYLNFKYGDTNYGAIRFFQGGGTLMGYFYSDSSGIGILPPDGSWGVRVTNDLVEAYHQHRAPIYYDSSDTSYYLDPANGDRALKTYGSVSIGTVGHLGLGDSSHPKVVYPGKEASWDGSGSTTGAVVITLPGTLSNYDMMYMEIDVYEYSGDNGSKIIIGGHNWNSGGTGNTSSLMWHNTGVKVVGSFNKPIYFGWRNDGTNNRRVIVLGETNSSWSYGTVHVSKVSGACYYADSIDYMGDWVVAQTTSSSYYTKNPTTNFNSTSSPTLITYGSVRGSVFYDINNTNYYVNPNDTTSLRTVGAWRADSSTWDGEFNGKIQHHGSYWYMQSANGVLVRNSSGANNVQLNASGVCTAANDWRAPQFYDSADTNYYLDPNGTSRLNKINITSAGAQGLNITSTDIRSSATSTWTGNPGANGKIQYHSNRWYIVGDSSSNRIVQFRRDGSDVSYIDNSGRLIGAPDARAPIFYDSDDTNYYLNPASNSVMNTINGFGFSQTGGNGKILVTNSSNGYLYLNNWLHTDGAGIFSSVNGAHFYPNQSSDYGAWRIQGTRNGWTGITFEVSGYYQNVMASASTIGFYNDTENEWMVECQRNSHTRLYYNGSEQAKTDNGLFSINNVLHTPITYDSNNTGFYSDPASTSRVDSIMLRSTINFPVNSPSTTHGSGHRPAYGIYQEGGAWSHPYPDLCIAMHTGIKMGANASYNGIRFYTDYDMATQVMAINDSSSPIGASHVYVNNVLQAGSSLRTPVFYNSNNTAHYLDLDSTSKFGGDIHFLSTNSIWFNSLSTSGNYLRLHGGTSSGAYFDFNSTGSTKKMHWRQYGSHTRFTWDYSTAAFLAMGSITANGSDERLKENIVTIDGALDKVKQMRGVYFNRTDIEPNKKRVGFIAQEVKPILPEVVEEAGKVDGYEEYDEDQILTISYANITALIVEAVKEQQTIIDDLKSRIETLENQ